jgi:predicted short-subunit dehydrogenase-like oxidoreductase (DUF2520 family)
VKSLNVIGCGNVGRTLAKLWTDHGAFDIQCILNRSAGSGQRAADFVGAGRGVAGFHDLVPSDVVMIAASDEAIESCCVGLCETGTLGPGTIVFHCSGSLPSSILSSAKRSGADIASLHPVKSFADPTRSVETFRGTFCALEGDASACRVLGDALTRCGAQTFRVRPDAKPVYHAATVFVCNYLVALMEAGLKCFEQAGLPRETALQVVEPIIRGTLENVLTMGPARALTGPIARGEPSVVQRQVRALSEWDERIAQAYRIFGELALELSETQGTADLESLERIREMLRGGE